MCFHGSRRSYKIFYSLERRTVVFCLCYRISFHDAKFSTMSHSMTSPSPMYYRFPSFRATPPSERTAQQCLAEILCKSDRCKKSRTSGTNEHGMPSPEGKPTEPMLRAEVKEEVKQESKGKFNPWSIGRRWFTNASFLGGGLGSWSMWKASEIAKR